MENDHGGRKPAITFFPSVLAIVAAFIAPQACGGLKATATHDEVVGTVAQAISPDLPDASAPDFVPCDAWSFAVVANTGDIVLNAGTRIDAYSSSVGPYGGANAGVSAVGAAATTVINNGGVLDGIIRPYAAGLSVVPVPAGATNLPLQSTRPGSLNINSASASITLAPGNYVATDVTVNFPGAIQISPAGQVRIW